MQQVSLLGGLGNGQVQTMRPDRVHATGVLSPMVGYRPGYDVQEIARQFTTGPSTGMQLGRFGAPRLGDKLRAWWHGVKARASGGMPNFHASPQAFVATSSIPRTATEPVLHEPGPSMPPGRTGWGGGVNANGYSMAPAAHAANFIGPFGQGMPSNLVTQAYGQSSSLPPYAADAAAKTTMMMWRGLRWPWH